MTLKPDAEKVYIGEPVYFECQVKLSSGWEYIWYKDGKQITVNSPFSIPSAASFDNGTYKCMARRTKTMYETNFSEERVLSIFGEPKKGYSVLMGYDVFYLEEQCCFYMW